MLLKAHWRNIITDRKYCYDSDHVQMTQNTEEIRNSMREKEKETRNNNKKRERKKDKR